MRLDAPIDMLQPQVAKLIHDAAYCDTLWETISTNLGR